MDQTLENRIRERAYEMWTAHGCVHGQAEQHWLAAERETVGDIDGSPRRQTRSEEEPTVVRTFEDRQNGREGWLTLPISPEMPAPCSAAIRTEVPGCSYSPG